MSEQKQIRYIADTISERLAEQGVTIQRYDAYSSNSVYLKFDYGVLNSLRISDHKCKKHLHYMYNIDVKHQGPWRREVKKFTRYYFGTSEEHIEKFITQVLRLRGRKMTELGYEGYLEERLQQSNMNALRSGFWDKARLMYKGTPPKPVDIVGLNSGVLKW